MSVSLIRPEADYARLNNRVQPSALTARAQKASAAPAIDLPPAYLLEQGSADKDAAVYKTYDAEGQVRLLNRNGSTVSAPGGLSDGSQSQTVAKAEDIQKMGVCQTCAERKYQDKSSDPGVSFQMATHVSSAASVAMVSSHEREHEARETRDAEENGQKAITNVRIQMAQCPECKTWYAAGGVTEVTKISTGDQTAEAE